MLEPRWTLAADQLGAVAIPDLADTAATWLLDKDKDTTAEMDLYYGLKDHIPVAGKWASHLLGDHPGSVDQSFNWLLDTNADAAAEISIQFGSPGDIPVVGDWNGDGVDQPGVYRGTEFFRDLGDFGYQGETGIPFGLTGAKPVVGDWDGDGEDEFGVWQPNPLNNNRLEFVFDVGEIGFQNEAGFVFDGLPTDKLVAGDFNGDGRDDVALIRRVDGYLRWHVVYTGANPNSHPANQPDIEYFYGLDWHEPIVGNWQFPEITISDPPISTGSPTPIDFGASNLSAVVRRSFTVLNDGTVPLNIGTPVVTGGFHLVEGITSTLAPGQSDTFTIGMNTGQEGAKQGSIAIPSSDITEPTFHFRFAGYVRPQIMPSLGVVQQGPLLTWYLDTDRDPTHEIDLSFGVAGTKPVVGKWNGISHHPAVVDASFNWLLDADGDAEYEQGPYQFGAPGDTPVVGDWDGDGDDDLGVYRSGTFHLDDNARGWAAGTTTVVSFGLSGDVPLVGDWDRDGNDDLGVWRVLSQDQAEVILDVGERGIQRFFYGRPGDRPLAGDVNGDGRDDIIMTRGGFPDGLLHWLVAYTLVDPSQHGPLHDVEFVYGFPSHTPVFGSWLLPEITVNEGQFWSGWPTPISVGERECGSPGKAVFSIRNQGTAWLGLGTPVVSGRFVLSDVPTSALPPGDVDTFEIAMDTSSSGPKSGRIVIPSFDGNEQAFTFDVAGTVTPCIATTFSVRESPNGRIVRSGESLSFETPLFNADEANFALYIENPLAFPVSVDFSESSGDLLLLLPSNNPVVPAMGQTPFWLKLRSPTLGSHTSHIVIKSTNPQVPRFEMDVTIQVVPGSPEIAVLVNGVEVSSGRLDPLSAGETGIGVLSNSVLPVVIKNIGTAPMRVRPPTVASPHFVAGYQDAFGGGAIVLDPQKQMDAKVRLTGRSIGTQLATLTILSDDPDESAFTFKVTGTVLSSPPPPPRSPRFGGSIYFVVREPTQLTGTDNQTVDATPRDVVLLTSPNGTDYHFEIVVYAEELGLSDTAVRIDAISDVVCRANESCDLVFSVDTPTELPEFGIVRPVDLVRFRKNSFQRSWEFEHSDIVAAIPNGANSNIDAFDQRGALLLFSFASPTQLPNVGLVGDEDVVQWNGGWQRFVGGLSDDLEEPTEGVNALAVRWRDDIEIGLVTDGPFQVPGSQGDQRDVVAAGINDEGIAVWLGRALVGADFGLADAAINALDWGSDEAPADPPIFVPGDRTNDRVVNISDIDPTNCARHSGTYDPLSDLNGDSTVNGEDVSYLIDSILGTSFGDIDLNQRIDRADVADVARNFGRLLAGSWQFGDFNCDGRVDMEDLQYVVGNLSSLSSSSANSLMVAAVTVSKEQSTINRGTRTHYDVTAAIPENENRKRLRWAPVDSALADSTMNLRANRHHRLRQSAIENSNDDVARTLGRGR